MKKDRILCIDLTKYNQTKLKEIAQKYTISLDFLVTNKKADLVRIWIDLDFGIMVSYTTKKNKQEVVFTDFYRQALLGIQPLELPKKEIVYSVDSILDKISKYGIESLTESEKIFLNSQ